MSAFKLQFHRGGVFLPQLGLWLDPHTRQAGPERVFVSHAHSDHIGAHREVILTQPTARLMDLRVRSRRVEHVLPWHEARAFSGPDGPFKITLLPAGHILGSAMALIEFANERLLYTGDFKLRPSPAAEACDLAAAKSCDVLIMETTFGRPEYRFPPSEVVVADLVRFCRETLAVGATPVLLAYSLGKSQELLHALAGTELVVQLHRQAHAICGVYESLGHRLPDYESMESGPREGAVVIYPPGASRPTSPAGSRVERCAVVTGWAVDRGCRFRYGVDAAFPLSDHADYPDLIEFVRQLAPKKVFTLHGFAVEFASTLREMGCDATALGREEQLELRLGLRRPIPSLRSED